MDKNELKELIKEAVKEEVSAATKKEIENKVEEEVKEQVSKETQVKIAPPIKEEKIDLAQKEADSKKWSSFGEFLNKVWNFRLGYAPIPDNRLVFVDKSGNPSVPAPEVRTKDVILKTMTEGTDSAGGCELMPSLNSAICWNALRAFSTHGVTTEKIG